MIIDEPWSAPVGSRTLAHHGHVWDVVTESFRYNGETLVRDFLDHPGAVAVVAMNDQGQLLLIQQYRHPIRSRDWELPAGLLDAPGESPLAAAKRELAEEADLLASDWAVLIDFATSPGGSNEVIRIFLARGLSAAPGPHQREAEEVDIALRWLSLDEAVEAVLAGTVRNGPLIVAILAAKAASERGWVSLGDPDSDWPDHPANRE